MEAILALEDGRVFRGRSLGASGRVTGEVVFNTGMTGYQEILTDPSYRGQIVTLTVPHVGNTGVNEDDPESGGPQAAGLIVRQGSRYSSSWRSLLDLDHYLRTHHVVGIEEIDTRALTRHLRSGGVLRGCLSSDGATAEQAVRTARDAKAIGEKDLVSEVTCREPYEWSGGRGVLAGETIDGGGGARRIAVLDCGIKRNILRLLADHGFRPLVFPAMTSAQTVLDAGVEGLFLSNGPGDPARCTAIVRMVRELVGRLPIFGICLGHQLTCLALGASTFKLKFGHRGINHPVHNEITGEVAITSQNHGYAVDAESIGERLLVTHRSLYDGTVEGICHREEPVFTVQFHPEAAPGPHDACSLFHHFAQMLDSRGPLQFATRRRSA